MEFFHTTAHYNFMGYRKATAYISIFITLFCLTGLFTKGLNFALDFTGGTQFELRYEKPVDLNWVREILNKEGYHGKVSHYGGQDQVMLRLPEKEAKTLTPEQWKVFLHEHLSADQNTTSVERMEFVGSEVGEELAQQGILAVLVALVATMLYIAFRFEYRFAFSSALALMHDPIVILGVFAWFQLEFDIATLASILAVLGYSLNDTIVVFDRIRENFKKVRKGTPCEILNLSINETLSRTIMTSVLTLLVVVALYCLGGEALKGFSLAFIIGILVGTYSSIYIASSLALTFGISRLDFLPRPKQPEDALP